MRTMRLATAALVGAASVISLTAPTSYAMGDDHHHHRRAHIRVHPKVAWSGERVHVRVRCPRAKDDDVRTIRAFSEAFRRDHITLHRDGIFRDRDRGKGKHDRGERLYVGSGKVEFKHRGHRREADRDDRWGGWVGPPRHHHHRHHRRHRRHFLITGRCPHDGFFRTHIQVVERRHHRRHHRHGGGYGGGYNGGGYNGGGYNGGGYNGGRRSGGSYPMGGVKAGEGGSVNNGNALETGAGGALAAAAIGGGAWALRRRRTGE
jgi:hypothetical protein